MKIDKAKFIELYNQGLEDKDLASAFGVTINSIHLKRRAYTLPPNPSSWKLRLRTPRREALKGFKPTDSDKPWRDPESLFCDTKFLETLFKKQIKECGSHA